MIYLGSEAPTAKDRCRVSSNHGLQAPEEPSVHSPSMILFWVKWVPCHPQVLLHWWRQPCQAHVSLIWGRETPQLSLLV